MVGGQEGGKVSSNGGVDEDLKVPDIIRKSED